MGGGAKAPPDNSYAVEELRQQEAARQREFDRIQIENQRARDIQAQAEARANAGQMYERQQADQLAAEQRVRAQQESERTRAEQIAAQAKAEEAERTRIANYEARHKFNQGLDEGVARAQTRAQQALQKRGVDPSLYNDDIINAITDQRASVPDLAPNVGAYFNADFVNTILGEAQTQKRREYGNTVNSKFATGFERNLFADTADDDVINSILGTQRSEAQTAIQRAKERGNLDDTGMQRAMQKLGEMETAGRATANTLGGTVLEGNRERLRSVADRAREAASGYELGTNFDPNAFFGEADATYNTLAGNLGGEVRNALNGQNFFDVDAILGAAGAAQGGVNPNVAPTGAALDAIAERDRLRNTHRGVGRSGGGVF